MKNNLQINLIIHRKPFRSELIMSCQIIYLVVIGNPPYGAKLEKEEKKKYKAMYPESQFKIDTYSLFVLHSMKILSENGVCTFIIPNTLLDNYFEEAVRKKLLLLNKINEICDLNDKVFESAVVHAMILSFINKIENNYEVSINTSESLYGEKTLIPKSFFIKQEKFIFSIRSHSSDDLFTKLSYGSTNLNNVIDIRQAIKSGDDKVFLVKEMIDTSYKPILRGKDVFKYSICDPQLYIHYGRHLACPRTKEIFEQPKLLIREAGAIITATYDEANYYIMSSLYNAIIRNKEFDLKYVLGLINSTLFQFLMNKLTFEKTKGAFTKAKIYHYYNLPVKITSNQQPIILLVDKILDAKKINPTADTTAIETEIDRMVYELYGLTETEIAIIENN